LHIAAHDLKSPLANISVDLLISDYSDAMNQEEGNEILNLSSSDKLKEMIDSLLIFSKSITIEKVKLVYQYFSFRA
jgi:signal transduction histidine kinase